MKNLLIAIITTTIFTSISTSLFSQSNRDQIEVKVDGLGCPFCAYGLEKKFKEFKGIKDVKIEMETGIFTFTYPSEKSITLEQIEDQVDAAGYTAVKTVIVRSTGESESSEMQSAKVSSTSELIKEEVFVAGNCGMCKSRIEKAAKTNPGVINATWDKDTKLLVVEFDKDQTDINKIAASISKAGHDTKMTKADDKTYDSLPGCCHYERLQ